MALCFLHLLRRCAIPITIEHHSCQRRYCPIFSSSSRFVAQATLSVLYVSFISICIDSLLNRIVCERLWAVVKKGLAAQMQRIRSVIRFLAPGVGEFKHFMSEQLLAFLKKLGIRTSML